MISDLIGAIIVLSIFIVLSIVLIILFATQSIPPGVDQQSAEITALLNSVSLQAGFQEKPSTVDGIRGECNLYTTFVTTAAIVDKIEPFALFDDVPVEFQCDDGYSIPLQKFESQCLIDLCRGVDGLDYTKGEYQQFYSICAKQNPCENGRSAIILNYDQTINGKLERTSRCVASNGSSTSCPTTSTSQISNFLNVDTTLIPFTNNYLSTRIRIPGSGNCLVPFNGSISTQICLDRTDKGYSWILTTANPSDVENGQPYYPPRLVVSPTPIPTDPDELNTIIRNSSVLMSNGNNLILSPYTTCIVGQTCNPSLTNIVSGFEYQNIV